MLSAEKFSELAGYKVAINKPVSTQSVCMYKGGDGKTGMLMILNEDASPRSIEMANSEGSVPQGES